MSKDGGNGEFFLIQENNGSDIVVFSNNKGKHSNTAVIGFAMKSEKFDEIKTKMRI
jgi:hypothetical protein